jgi:hypothetical protein
MIKPTFVAVKKFLVILILVSYSIASFGVSLNYFYCCGKLKTISFVAKGNSKTCKGNKGKGCCKNEKVTVKLKTDHKTCDDVKCNCDAPLSVAIIQHNDYAVNSFYSAHLTTPLYKRPPPNYLPKRNLLFCVFRI